MKKSNTRRALLLSVISLLLCISMLIGTTYAWFTDTVTSAGNKIVAGTLKIDLQLLDKDTGIWNSIKENQDPIFTYEKWEPGYTDVKVLKVENLGTLALKWKACFLSETELGILADVIDVYVKPGVTAYPTDRVDLTGWKNAGTVREFAEGIESTTVGTLLKDQEATLGIALKMRESAGNEYQGEILEAFDIRIMATQLANESDSFDDQYDALAEYDGEITNMSGLQAALNNGGTYKLINDIDLTETVEGSASATTIIDLNGKKINNADGASIKNNGKLTIIDSAAGTSTFGLRARAVGGGISGTTTTVLYNYGELNLKAGTYGSESNYALRNYGKMALNKATVTSGILCSGADADLEITDSTVSNARTGTHVIYVGGSTVTINSGSFNNEIANNATILSSGGKVIIKDGTFSIGSKSYLFDGTGYEISGGTFNGGIRGTYTITGGEFNNANGSGYNIYTGTAISGGTFPADCKVENHLADGYAAIESGEEKIILPAGYELAGEGVLVNGNDYYIYNANGFLWVEAQADNFFAGKTVKLFNDIDCTDVAIKAIKFWNPENKTTFDGQNYTIYNLDISTAPSSGNQALFNGTVDIKNLTVDGAWIQGSGYVAVLGGTMYGNIENCHVKNAQVFGSYWQVGGLAGQYNSGNVINCSVTDSEIYGPSAVGAIVGILNETSGERKLENCVVKNCKIEANGGFGGDYDNFYGTMIGLINIENSKVYFNDCAVENSTVKGEATTEFCGVVEAGTTVYVDGVAQ